MVVSSAIERAFMQRHINPKETPEEVLEFFRTTHQCDTLASLLGPVKEDIFDGIVGLLWEHVEKMQLNSAHGGNGVYSKFSAGGGNKGFELKYGDLSTFFGGLDAKIGRPDPNIFEAMENEHMRSEDSLDNFTTYNYNITTTPQLEWRFVVVPSDPPAGGWPKETIVMEDYSKMRQPLSRPELVRRCDEVNEKLSTIYEKPLMLEEAIGGRMYTVATNVHQNLVTPLVLMSYRTRAGSRARGRPPPVHALPPVKPRALSLTTANFEA